MATEKMPPPEGGYLFPRLAVMMRERLGIKPSELARRLGKTAAAVSQYEDPDKPITEATLRMYAAALDSKVPFEDLLFETLIAFRLQARTPAPPEPTT